jgi:hypothetical protein
MPQSFYPYDKNDRPMEYDTGATNGTYGYPIGMSLAHHKIHEGDNYECWDYDNDVDTGGPKYWLIKAPSVGKIHFTYAVAMSKNGLLEMYKDPTTSADGSVLTCFNSNENSTNTSILEVYKDPTVSVDGTRRRVEVIGSDTTGPPGAKGGGLEHIQEIILNQGANYLIKVTVLTNDTRVSIEMSWYETD